MYAVIKVGGKQQRVKTGDVIEVEHHKGEEPGGEITFRPILVVDDDGKAHHGKVLEKANVVTKVVGEERGDKVRVVKYKNKTRYTRHKGHRQLMSLLEVGDISLPGGAKKAAAKAEPKAAEATAKDEAPAPKPKPKAKAKEEPPAAEETLASEPPATPETEGEVDVESEGGE